MNVIVKGSFDRDADSIRGKELRIALDSKLQQIEKARDISQITGLKLLRNYSHHFRIVVKAGKFSYRIGAIIRNEKVWVIRFLPRKKIYQKFP